MVIVIDNSETITRNQFVQIKSFIKRLMQPYANSENNVHFGLLTFASTPNKASTFAYSYLLLQLKFLTCLNFLF